MAEPADEFARVALPLMDQVYAVALYLVRSRHEADDLLQETYLRAYRFWHQFAAGTNCKAWLLTILYNVHRRRYRERERQPQVASGERLFEPGPMPTAGAADSNPEEVLLRGLLDEEVEAALRQLPADYLDAVVLVDVQELSYEEAARAIGCPVGTVRSRLSRGRRFLYEALRGYAVARGLLRSKA